MGQEYFFWCRVIEDLNLTHSRREHSGTDILFVDSALDVKKNFFWCRVIGNLNLSHSRRGHSDTNILCTGSVA